MIISFFYKIKSLFLYKADNHSVKYRAEINWNKHFENKIFLSYENTLYIDKLCSVSMYYFRTIDV